MKIIALRGAGSCGKTTTLNLVYDDLISKGAILFVPKTQVGGDKKDFEAILTYRGKNVAIYTMGDYSNLTIKAIDKYVSLRVDVFICASNNRFKRPIKKILTFSNDIVIKSVAIISANRIVENTKDANTIVGLI
jgi:predicted dinucleotide-utilizing enzyme